MEMLLFVITILLSILVTFVVIGVGLLCYGLYRASKEEQSNSHSKLENTLNDLVVNIMYTTKKIKWLKRQDFSNTDLQEVDNTFNTHHFRMERQMMWIEFKQLCKLRYKKVEPYRMFHCLKRQLRSQAE